MSVWGIEYRDIGRTGNGWWRLSVVHVSDRKAGSGKQRTKCRRILLPSVPIIREKKGCVQDSLTRLGESRRNTLESVKHLSFPNLA